MKPILTTLLTACLFPLAVLAEAPAGLTMVKSNYDVETTTDKLVGALEAKGLTVFARIDHAQGAENAGLQLRPTQLVIFGDPKLGTALMHCGQTAGIDLPLKALIWQDAEDGVWLGYNAPAYLSERHGLAGCEAPVKKATGALVGLTKAATE